MRWWKDDDDDYGGEAAELERNGLSQQVANGDQDEPQDRVPKTVHGPKRVSKAERDAHNATHIPYRDWCPHCVKGRGRSTAHKKQTEEDKETDNKVPRILMDYFYMTEEDRKAHRNPLICIIDEETKERYARAVGQKGLGENREMDWLIKDVSAELKVWGHPGGTGGHIIIKSDGERAIVAVREAVSKFHGGKVVPEAPARGESQSNGAIEEAGKTIREYVRVLKDQIETNAKIKLSESDNVVQWMVRWSAMMWSRYAVGRDSRTAYERRRGRR